MEKQATGESKPRWGWEVGGVQLLQPSTTPIPNGWSPGYSSVHGGLLCQCVWQVSLKWLKKYLLSFETSRFGDCRIYNLTAFRRDVVQNVWDKKKKQLQHHHCTVTRLVCNVSITHWLNPWSKRILTTIGIVCGSDQIKVHQNRSVCQQKDYKIVSMLS